MGVKDQRARDGEKTKVERPRARAPRRARAPDLVIRRRVHVVGRHRARRAAVVAPVARARQREEVGALGVAEEAADVVPAREVGRGVDAAVVVRHAPLAPRRPPRARRVALDLVVAPDRVGVGLDPVDEPRVRQVGRDRLGEAEARRRTVGQPRVDEDRRPVVDDLCMKFIDFIFSKMPPEFKRTNCSEPADADVSLSASPSSIPVSMRCCSAISCAIK